MGRRFRAYLLFLSKFFLRQNHPLGGFKSLLCPMSWSKTFQKFIYCPNHHYIHLQKTSRKEKKKKRRRHKKKVKKKKKIKEKRTEKEKKKKRRRQKKKKRRKMSRKEK